MKQIIPLAGLVAAVMLAAGVVAAADTPLSSGLKIVSGRRITAGTYNLKDPGDQAGVVEITGRGFTVDFKGAKLIGPGGVGVGIKISDATNVTIRNADVSGYLWGVVLERCSGVKLINCSSSRNADLPAGTVIDESGTSSEDTHGGGFVLRDCKDCQVSKCTAQHQSDGIDLVRSTGNIIENGDYSFNGNWGLHLWTSSNNTFRNNRAIWCTTGSGLLYQALTGWQTYDAQAVGIDHNSNDNTIEQNDLRFGGDGIFIRANEGGQSPGQPVPVKNGSNRNRLLYNDCSFSPNNAIEVDFVEDTLIVGNNCSNSNYGMWLGYSVRSVCKQNTCVNDSTHAVEIENGQNGVFEGNVFGWDNPRPDGQLVLLRQNGNDKTPSGPYTINNNLFYGAGVGVQLVGTAATLDKNYLAKPEKAGSVLWMSRLVAADARSSDSVSGTLAASGVVVARDRKRPGTTAPPTFVRGSQLAAISLRSSADDPVPVVEVNGVPLWTRKTRDGRITAWLPDDGWIYPLNGAAVLTVTTARGGRSICQISLASSAFDPVIANVAPIPAQIGEDIGVVGSHIQGGHFLLNGKEAQVVSRDDGITMLKMPIGILTPTKYNLVWEKGEGADRVATWPIVVAVDVPAKQMPHFVSATFSPTTVKVGELLTATMTVRNNLPVPAMLTTKMPSVYDEKQAWYEMGLNEMAGHLNLRVSTDFFVGGHHPGSWPWMFGFDKAVLQPGETATVVCEVRLQTPGEHVFRMGLVAGGSRFIDDNAYQTKITVVP